MEQENRGANAGRKLESVIVIDSDSEGERDGTRRHHSNTSSAPPISISPRSGKESRPDSTGHLPPGPSNKPPPLTVVSSANSKANRTTATVTPFSQSASTVTVTSGNGGAGTNQALAATRTSSFAAALRKLAKQANDNGPDEISPRTSPASTTRSSASTPSKYHLGPSPLVVPTSSPPVVTIAPTHTTSSALDSRRELERRSQSNSVDRSLGRSLSGEGASSIWRGKESPSLGLGPRR
ncbi:genetic suppressor element 1-like [Lytechinus variegatus]|uniref:genetic suppressor element 1-like n=1 Tax=Lytechinus variegatus TaxID=7654 RepID=UPI001BB14031|nr:genetic suppressor element 1-like [Lytechinus variegatus]